MVKSAHLNVAKTEYGNPKPFSIAKRKIRSGLTDLGRGNEMARAVG